MHQPSKTFALLLLLLLPASYQDREQLPGCLDPMGIDTESIKFMKAKDTSVSTVTAMVMKAADERIFVVFKVCRAARCSCCL